MHKFFFIFFIIFFLGGYSQLFAAIQAPQDKNNLKTVQGEIHRIEGELESSKRTAKSLHSELQKLDRLLKLQALEIKLSTLEVEQQEEKVQEIQIRIDSLHEAMAARKHEIRRELSILPSLTTNNPLAKLADTDHDMQVWFQETLRRLLQRGEKEVVALKGYLEEEEALNADLNEERNRLLAHLDDLKEKQAILALNHEVKVSLLKRTKSEQGEYLRAYRHAREIENNLEVMITQINRGAEKQQEQTVQKHSLSSFALKKGQLILPVEGKVINNFGRKYDAKTSLYTFHKGIEIETAANTPVHAVFSGKVVFAGSLGGYGKLLILDHGGQYYSLVGHLGEILKKEGDQVKEGEVISHSAADATPVYFEIRQRHIAVNPVNWVKHIVAVDNRIGAS